MGFFKWLDKYIRESNETSRELAAEREERDRIWREKKAEEGRKEAEEYRSKLKMVRCCSNCRWYEFHRCENRENEGKDRSEYTEDAINIYTFDPYFKDWSAAREVCDNFEPLDD